MCNEIHEIGGYVCDMSEDRDCIEAMISYKKEVDKNLVFERSFSFFYNNGRFEILDTYSPSEQDDMVFAVQNFLGYLRLLKEIEIGQFYETRIEEF